jgi:hypothetical protein
LLSACSQRDNRQRLEAKPKWLSRAFDALPRLAGEIGPQLECCLALEDARQGRVLLDPVLAALVEEQNHLGITRPAALGAPDPIRERGLAPFSLQDVEGALRESFPPSCVRWPCTAGATSGSRTTTCSPGPKDTGNAWTSTGRGSRSGGTGSGIG